MRRGWSALAVILLGASGARADYLFMQYQMGVKRNQPAGPGGPGNTGQPPGGPPPNPGGPPAGPPGGPPGANNNDVVVLAVNSVVEISKKDLIPNMVSGRVKYLVRHKYGQTPLFNDETLTIRLITAKTVRGR